jgi:hypothetical protein
MPSAKQNKIEQLILSTKAQPTLIHITLTGIKPLLMNRFTDEQALKIEGGSSAVGYASENGTPREQAEPKIYRDAGGNICIPSMNVLRSIFDGGFFHKAGKKQITTKKESMLCSCISIRELDIPLISTTPWEVDSRAIVNPSTGGRRLCHRPRFDVWSLSFTIEWDGSLINLKLLRQIIDDAGKRIGLGDFRPAKKGPFGRYVVTQWKAEQWEMDLPEVAAA